MYSTKDQIIDALAGIALVTCVIGLYIIASAADLAIVGM